MIGTKKKSSTSTTSDYKNQQTPYGGAINGVPVETAPHLIVSGPTGRGKSLRVMVPGALLWSGPRVIVSSKTDFLKEVVNRGIHQRGPLYIMDLAGELDRSFDWLQGVEYTRVISDPTVLIENDDDALTMSSLLMTVSGGEGGDNSNSAFWENLTTQPLAAILAAAKASGEGIGWAVRAAGKVEKNEPTDPSPSWAIAYELVKDTSFHAADLLSVAQMDGKLKDSMMATMKSGLTPWLFTNVRGAEGAVPFSPKMLEGPGEPTLAIIAPADGVATGAAVAVVETIIRHWRRGIERGLERVLLSVDEFCNVMPLPKISTYLSEARGLGVACVLATQSLQSQLQEKYGEARAATIREVAPAVLILQGDAGSQELLESAAWWEGEEDSWTESIDDQGHKTLTAQRVQRQSPQGLLPTNLDEGRLLLYGQKGRMVELPGIWQS